MRAKLFLFMRMAFLTLFLFVIAVAVMDHRTKNTPEWLFCKKMFYL